ncbi:MAG TPA: erythromycin esterase family protein [Chitinophagaceae bacterium]|nr:erythromycin esterase family protein [Chitinophagaceae bacterium]
MRPVTDRMPRLEEKEAIHQLRERSHTVSLLEDLDPLIDRIGDARIVMLGEASHGTHEYYTWRTYLTQRLIKEKGFNFLAVEGDWPDCYRLNRYIKNYSGSGGSALEVLRSFRRWPTWMWANWEMVALSEWLARYNQSRPLPGKVGFYGLDVYSLWESMESILGYLRKTDPAACRVAEEAWRCFEPYREQEGHGYAQALQWVPTLCETEVVDMLKEVRRRLPQYNSDYENVFSVEQNALVAVNAERYYRAMIAGGPHSWNVRDRHMTDTLERLLAFHGKDSRAIVWEHNTHIGDARATDMTSEGMVNIGELARMKYGQEGVALVGFGAYRGRVVAAARWGAPMRVVDVPAARQGSWESLLHLAGNDNKFLWMDDFREDLWLENHLDHRAIGVVYQPEHERFGNYVPSLLPLRYDAFVYLDQTRALHPLHLEPDGHLMPETYPFGV